MLPEYLKPAPTKPDHLLLGLETTISSQITSYFLSGIGVLALSWFMVAPKDWRVVSAGSVWAIGETLSRVEKVKRTHKSRLDALRGVYFNAELDNTLQEATLPFALTAPMQIKKAFASSDSPMQEEESWVTTPATVKFFDWNSLRVTHKSDQYKPRLILAPTGGGKTTLIDLLSMMLAQDGSYQMFLAPDVQVGQFEHIPSFGGGMNWGSMQDGYTYNLKDLLEGRIPNANLAGVYRTLWVEYEARRKAYQEAHYYSVINFFIDEWREQALTLGDIFASMTKQWMTGIRKTFMVPWFVTQIANVVSLKLEGEGALRENLEIIYLAEAADGRVKELIEQGLWSKEMYGWYRAFVQDQNKRGMRVALVNDEIALIPYHTLNKAQPTYGDIASNGNTSIPVYPVTNTSSNNYGGSSIRDPKAEIIVEYERLRTLGKSPSVAIKEIAKQLRMEYKDVKELLESAGVKTAKSKG